MFASLSFWTSVLLIGYAYLGYAILIRAWASLCPKPIGTARLEPSVTVLVVAYNEAARIEGRIENLLDLDYPADRLEILVASDGSTDGTDALARRYEAAGVTVVALEERRGKVAAINALVPRARGEIVVLADARQRFGRDVLRALVVPFGDPRVGAVSGELMLTPGGSDTGVGEGVGVYWSWEKSIRRNESRVDSAVGATGAIYAIRRRLFEPIAEDTILDDVLIPMRIVRRGFRVVFEGGARAYDRPASTAREEFTRKVRTIAGNFQLFARERWLMNPFRNRLWLQTVSHKGLRLIGPLLFATMLSTSLLLLDRPFYRFALAGQLAFYLAALLGATLRRACRAIPLLSLPYLVCLLNWATVVAFVRFLTGRQRVTWDRVSA
jgi:poly-beta-1,6-N-acetyl-D-glucosamine synthase